jgi:hypothetical protein
MVHRRGADRRQLPRFRQAGRLRLRHGGEAGEGPRHPKLIELHGLVYSEEEADEFKQERPGPAERVDTQVEVVPPAGTQEAELRQKIAKAKSINAVTDLMLHADTQRVLNDLPEGVRDDVRDFAKARLVELGWPAKKAA